MTNPCIEEVLHLLPPVKSLHVVLVGPEWRAISPGPTCSHFDKDTCPPCTQQGCKRTLSIYRCGWGCLLLCACDTSSGCFERVARCWERASG